MPPRAILFDLDETILQGYVRPDALWLSVAEEFASDLLPLTPARLAQAIAIFARDFWADADRHREWRVQLIAARRAIVAGALTSLAALGHAVPSPDVGRRLADRFSARREAELCLFPDAHAVIDTLRQRGLLLALVTNGAADLQRAKIDRFDLGRRFDHIQIEGEHGFGKPEERAYRHAMSALGVAAAQTWMVGDNLEWEVAAPQRLGIHAIWYDPAGAGVPAGSLARPDRIINSLSELLQTFAPGSAG
jgi:putative hydrolase of the HAD superfamily